MKNILYTLLFLNLLQFGCKKAADVHYPEQNIQVDEKNFIKTNEKTLQEFSIFIFRKSLSSEQWASVMSDVRVLNKNKIELANLRKQTVINDVLIDELVQKNIDIILNFDKDKLAYLLSWSNVENCAIQTLNENLFKFKCSPQYDIFGPNPLDGGSHLISEHMTRVFRTVPGTVIQDPYFNFQMTLFENNFVQDKVVLDIFFRLNTEDSFFGEVIVDEKSVFIKGQEHLNPYSYGVVQGFW